MKTTSKIFILLFALGIILSGQKATAVEKTKEYHQAWAVADVQTLQVVNRFGEVKVNNNPGSQITVDVKVTVEASSESKVTDLMDRIKVTFSKSGSTARAETSIENSFSGNKKLQIDYLINIPSDKNLEISNKYGNTIVNELKASGKFDIQYGNLNASSLVAPAAGSMAINLAYGKSTIGKAGDVSFDIKYSNASFDEAGNMKINSAYSVLNIDNAQEVAVNAKYDTYSFDNLASLDAMAKYSNFKVGSLTRKLRFESAYGGIKVGQIARDFESVTVNSSYGGIYLGLESLSYSLDASCSYCGIKYPQEKFKGDRSKGDTNITLNGKVGTDKGGLVRIKSSYGEIKLVQ